MGMASCEALRCRAGDHAGDRGEESVVQRRAEHGERRDDRQRDQSGDQRVFDGDRAVPAFHAVLGRAQHKRSFPTTDRFQYLRDRS